VYETVRQALSFFTRHHPELCCNPTKDNSQLPVCRAGSDGRRNTNQCIDSTMRPREKDLFGCTRSNPSQGSVPTDLTLASDLAFVFNASWVRLECCVDPLRPPGLPVKSVSGPTCPAPHDFCFVRGNRSGTGGGSPVFARRCRFRHGAKTISASDKQVNDHLYRAGTRYVSKSRLQAGRVERSRCAARASREQPLAKKLPSCAKPLRSIESHAEFPSAHGCVTQFGVNPCDTLPEPSRIYC
jgi:hypothetical protein